MLNRFLTRLNILVFFLFISIISYSQESHEPPFLKMEKDARAELQFAMKSNDSLALADALYELAVILQNKGQNDTALNFLNKAINIYINFDNKVGEANCLNQIGSIFRYFGSFDRAFENYIAALNLFISEKDTLGQISASNNLGIVYRNLNYLDKAKEYYFSALSLAKKSNSYHLVTVNNSLGSFHWYNGNNDSALYYYKQALSIRQYNLHIIERRCAVLNNIGNVYRVTNNVDSSFYYYNLSLKESRKNGFEILSAVSLKNLGYNYVNQKNYRKANKYLDESIELAKKTNLVRVLMEVYKLQSDILENQENYKKSLEKYRLYSRLKDSLMSANQLNKIRELEIEFRMQEAKKEQEFLKYELTQREIKIQKNRIFILSFISLILILITVSIALYLRHRSNKMIKNKLEVLYTELEEKVKTHIKSLEEEIKKQKK